MEESADGKKGGFGAQLAIMVTNSLRRQGESLWFSRAAKRRRDLWMEWMLSYSFGNLILEFIRVFLSLITLLTMSFKWAENEIRFDGRGRLRSMRAGSPPPPLPSQGIDFPLEIMLNILSRLSVESVFKCRQVCNTWRNLPLFDNNYFADLHRQHHCGLLLQQLSDQYNDNYINSEVSYLFLGRYKSFYYVEYDENDIKSYETVSRINLKVPTDIAKMVASSNGLVCLAVPHENNQCAYDPIYICNPITRECVNLPRLVLNDEQKHDELREIVHGFGYHPSTNEYKVVRIYYFWNQPCVGRVHVYTIGGGGGGGWRDKGEITNSLCSVPNCIFVNGYLHWMDYRERKIVAFNLVDEEFRVLPSPPCLVPDVLINSDTVRLRVLGGCLYLVHQRTCRTADIWSLKTTKCYDVMKEEYPWSREFTIIMPQINTRNAPFALTSNGEILLWKNQRAIIRYDPRTATTSAIGKLHADLFMNFEPILHLNSFVSLKALGANAKILGSTDGHDAKSA